MIFTFSQLLSNDALRISLGFSVLSFFVFYAVLSRRWFRLDDDRSTLTFFVLWMLFFTVEFFVFGPYSFVSMDSEGNLAIAIDHYLANKHDGGRFSHAFAGGQDLYMMYFGKQYFQPEVLLSYVFPSWIVILAHKIILGALGFSGSYLVARRVSSVGRLGAVAVATIFPVSHLYFLNFSTSLGTGGFAALPFAVYACVACSRRQGYVWWALAAAVVMSTAAPTHVFPAFLVAAVCGVILFDDIDIKQAALGFLLALLFSVLNWHEVLYALATGTGFTTRPQIDAGHLSFLEALRSSLLTFLTYPIAPFLFVASAATLFVRKDAFLVRALVAVAWVILSFAAIESVPWKRLGLPLLNSLTHAYMLLPVTMIAVAAGARALSHFPVTPQRGPALAFWRVPAVAVLALGLAILTMNKIVNFGTLVWFGGQSSYVGYSNLRDPAWKPAEDFRVVTLFETPNANITAGYYGYDTFDGQLNVNPKAWSDYWVDVVHRDPTHNLTTRTGIKWRYWDGKSYDIEKHIRLDLLGIANVRYLFSALPLKSKSLKLVHAPDPANRAKARRDFFPDALSFYRFRVRRIFDTGELYVYELPRVMPRVFAARKIEIVSDMVAPAQRHERVAAMAPARTVVVSESDGKALKAAGVLRLVGFQKVVDGYDVTVDAPGGGVLVVNNHYLPFWQARAQGRRLDIVPANGIQMAIIVPPETTDIKVRYRRPLLREKVAQWFD